MSAPEPGRSGAPLEQRAYGRQIERFAPGQLQGIELERKPSSLVNESFAKFTIAQDDATAFLERQLRRDNVIGQSSGADKQLDFSGLDEFAKDLPGRVEVFDETFGAMRFRSLFEGPPHLTPNGYRAGKKVDRARMESSRGRGTEKLTSGHLKGLERDIHRLELGVA